MRVKVPHVHIRAAGHHKKNARWRGEKELQNWKIKKMLENKKHKICQLKIDKILLKKRRYIQSLGIEKKDEILLKNRKYAKLAKAMSWFWDDGYWTCQICSLQWLYLYSDNNTMRWWLLGEKYLRSTLDSTVWGQNWFISLSCWASSCTQWPLRSLPNFVCMHLYMYKRKPNTQLTIKILA